MKPRDILEALINLLADQEGVEITYIKESFEDGLLADGRSYRICSSDPGGDYR
jgi:hypothetical protein